MIKAMTWNWMEGGLSSAELPQCRKPIPERHAAARALMERTRPDVLTLNEALGGDTAGVFLQNFGDILGFKHQVYGGYDRLWGNAILSQWPVLDVRRALIHKDGPQNRGLLAAKIEFPEGTAWVATYHPHPGRAPKKRAQDLQNFISELDGPAWVSADFNALQPGDEIDVGHLIEVHERFMSQQCAKEAVARFLESGKLLFEEVFPQLGWTPATPTERLPTMPTDLNRRCADKGMRIDHIVTGPGVECENAWVDQASEADIASDHYPVFAHLKLTPKN